MNTLFVVVIIFKNSFFFFGGGGPRFFFSIYIFFSSFLHVRVLVAENYCCKDSGCAVAVQIPWPYEFPEMCLLSGGGFSLAEWDTDSQIGEFRSLSEEIER